MTGVAMQLLARPDDAEDAVQEAFLQAFTHLHGYRGDASVKTWLLRIVINVCRNKQRQWWRRPWILVEDSRQLQCEVEPSVGQGDEYLQQQAVLEAVRRLPEKLRLPFVLHFLEDLTGAEVARLLGCKESTVWSRIYTARKVLQAQLKAWDDE